MRREREVSDKARRPELERETKKPEPKLATGREVKTKARRPGR